MKKKVLLTEKEMIDTCEIQKEMITSLGKYLYKYDEEKKFEIFSIAMALVISNTITSLGLNNIEPFLPELLEIVKNIHNAIKKNGNYIIMRDGKKIGEGIFN